jgi:hypothetical protein
LLENTTAKTPSSAKGRQEEEEIFKLRINSRSRHNGEGTLRMLIECPECRRSISDKARTCPQCGHPLVGSGDPALDYEMRKLARGRVVLIFLSGGFAFWFLLGNRAKDKEAALWCLGLSLVGLIVSHLRLSSAKDRYRD